MNSLVLGSDKTFFDGLAKVERYNFFSDCYKFFAERYSEENIIAAVVHNDETTPHMHLNLMPVMKEIEQQYMAYKILISGSAVEYDKFADKKTAQDFIYKLGYELIRSDCSESDEGHGLQIVNGNGLGVGPFLYEGIAEVTATYGLDMADYLLMYPFPKTYYEQFDKEKSIEEKYYAYRGKMISKCGIAFFIFGNKYDKNGNVINADGVRKEFDIAVKQKKYVFPIGATGYMAKELADIVLSDFELYNGEIPNIKILLQELNSDEITPDNIISKMVKIIDILAFTPECK